MSPPRLLSVQTGQPRTLGVAGAPDPLDRPWTSAIWKEPVAGRVWASQAGLSGDAHASRAGPDAADNAVLLYAAAHYRLWREEWEVDRLDFGAFGENLTVEGLDERTVCLGDVFGLGEVRVEVSAPREPCMSLVRRHRRPELIPVILANGRSGWYGRILEDGWLEAGVEIRLLDRPYPQWPVARAAEARRRRQEDRETARLLAACPALAAAWRRGL